MYLMGMLLTYYTWIIL